MMECDDLESLPRSQRSFARFRDRGFMQFALAVAMAACLALACTAFLRRRIGPSWATASFGEDNEAVGLERIAPPADTGLSLFCFSVMKPNSTEQALVEYQIRRRASIFACEEYAVICTEEMILSPGNGDVKTWLNPAPQVGMGTFGQPGVTTNSFLNTAIFIQAFDTLVKSKRIFKHDFLIKVDPDAVFFPDRARAHLLPLKGQNVYLTNCNRYDGQAPLGPKVFGAVEVYSVEAMTKYQKGHTQCANRDWHGWGEDYYMQSCMQMLGVPDHGDFLMVGDSRCNFAACTDATRMAYHPFKDLPSYEACFKQAIGEIA